MLIKNFSQKNTNFSKIERFLTIKGILSEMTYVYVLRYPVSSF